MWPKPTGRELRRYRFRGEAFACRPAGVAEEIAYVGAERRDYEHYDWNFACEVVGTGVQRTDIPMRELNLLNNVESRRCSSGSTSVRSLSVVFSLCPTANAASCSSRALASRPKLLLLDEVANGLDARNRARFPLVERHRRLAMPWFSPPPQSDVPNR